VIARVFLRQSCGGCELYASWFDIQRASARETRRHAQNQQEAGGCRARDDEAIKELIPDGEGSEGGYVSE
jgi:hypothetical protein